SKSASSRNLGAIVLGVATLALISVKETFLPLAGGTIAVLAFAGIRKNISWVLISILGVVLTACVLGMAYLIRSQLVSQGQDFYGQAVTTWSIAGFGLRGLASALGRVLLLYLIAGGLLAILRRQFPEQEKVWRLAIIVTIATCAFLVLMYALQGAI